MKRCVLFLLVAAMWAGCGGEPAAPDASKPSSAAAKAESPTVPTPSAVVPETPPGPAPVRGKSLLVAQSSFKQNDAGRYVVPDAAELLIVTPGENGAQVERFRDTESNVFHKAIPFGDGDIITIGAAEARLKRWTRQEDGKWQGRTLWHTSFGGKFDRLRDMEVADFDGDGKPDLAIATHDQGVVVVAWNQGDTFRIEEIDRKPDTFVHEIEVGDLDGDGKMEIYATPSDPNTASGHKQGGAVMRYAWNGTSFDKSVVAEFDSRHIKEILVADVDGDGVSELYAVLEAQMGTGMKIEVPVEIYRYDYDKAKKGFTGTRIAQIPDRFCRFLIAGDINHDGRTDLVAAAFSSGIHLIEKTDTGWKTSIIDKESAGFEHAAWMADLDGDGKLELYVADDRHGFLRRYVHRDGGFAKTDLNRRLVPASAMIWNITTY
jgi:hypothetical protein